MKIVSISMRDELLDDLDALQGELSFKGRSEVVRYALRLIREESASLEKLRGHLDCVMILMHEHAEQTMTKTLHDNKDLIKTQIHSKLCSGNKCLEVLLLHGSSGNIRTFYSQLRKNKKLDLVKLMVP